MPLTKVRGAMSETRSARRRPGWLGPAAALFVAAGLGGCGGGGPYPVDGKVVWEDGSPAKELAGSHVVFDLPEKQTSARGIVRPDGSFTLTTHKPDDGALAGEYRVLLIEANRKPLPGDETELTPTVMDSKYSDPSSSDLKATVTSGSNAIT